MEALKAEHQSIIANAQEKKNVDQRMIEQISQDEAKYC